MARVNDGSHDCTGHPHVCLRVEPGIEYKHLLTFHVRAMLS